MMGAEPGARARGLCGGFAYLEVVFAATLLALTVIAVGSAFGSNLSAARQARETDAGARFLEQTMAALDAQAFDNLWAMHGNVLLDHADPAAPRFSIGLSVREIRLDLLRITAVLDDRRNGHELARLVALRSRR